LPSTGYIANYLEYVIDFSQDVARHALYQYTCITIISSYLCNRPLLTVLILLTVSQRESHVGPLKLGCFRGREEKYRKIAFPAGSFNFTATIHYAFHIKTYSPVWYVPFNNCAALKATDRGTAWLLKVATTLKGGGERSGGFSFTSL
jgi:hypothetical protein